MPRNGQRFKTYKAAVAEPADSKRRAPEDDPLGRVLLTLYMEMHFEWMLVPSLIFISTASTSAMPRLSAPSPPSISTAQFQKLHCQRPSTAPSSLARRTSRCARPCRPT
jgi:hypothetical protein